MKRLLCLILILALAVTAAACTPKQYEIEQEAASLTAHFINVGQGDCTLFESRGEFVLIDAGEKDKGPAVLDYIKKCGANRLKYVIATHPHTDHIGGLKKVLDHVRTENFITVETDQSTRTWTQTLEAVERNNINYIDAEPGATYSFGEAEFTILAPLSDGYQGYNNYSVVTKVRCGNISFLMTGDAEKQSEKEMLNAGEDLRADVLKCGHHGSSSSSTAAFLKAVRPDYAVISCGRDNDYGHPHKETLKKLALLGCTVYRTDELGTVIAQTDGKTVTFSTDDGELETAAKETAASKGYIGNKNSRVFHLPSCDGVAKMSEKNKVYFDTREEAAQQGYTPCSKCEP